MLYITYKRTHSHVNIRLSKVHTDSKSDSRVRIDQNSYIAAETILHKLLIRSITYLLPSNLSRKQVGIESIHLFQYEDTSTTHLILTKPIKTFKNCILMLSLPFYATLSVRPQKSNRPNLLCYLSIWGENINWWRNFELRIQPYIATASFLNFLSNRCIFVDFRYLGGRIVIRWIRDNSRTLLLVAKPP